MIRLRIAFSKGGSLAYTSHLDLMRVWERSLRRAGVPLAYSRGFNPRPKLQLAAALPLGHTGEAELLDVWLEESGGEREQGEWGVERFVKALTPVLPDGLSVREVRAADSREPALQTQVTAAEYLVTTELPSDLDVEARIERVLAAAELPQERDGKWYDLRPLIEQLGLHETAESLIVLEMRLAARQGATARPEAVLEAMGLGEVSARYHRRQLLLCTG